MKKVIYSPIGPILLICYLLFFLMVDSQQTRILPDELRTTNVPAPGTILRERYRLDSELGRGGMGTVYRATDLELQREVAVKVLSAQNTDARERLIREARAAAALNHPHIVTIHDVGEVSGFPFLVMELVSGPRLSQARPTDFPRVVVIAVQICDALEHAHNNRIVHRDLKPDNVLLSGTGESSTVKLADLGLALPAYAARISRVGVIVGTAAYMAPEQALGQTIDGRADLYALGVLLYELTTGRVPFHRRRSVDDRFATRSRASCTAARAAFRYPTRSRNDHRPAARERSRTTIQLRG